MVDSILNSIKAMLGIPSTDTAFDTDIIIHINSTFMTLHQLGVGTENVFSIEDNSSTWQQFLSNPEMYSAVKSYIYLKVRMLFDPPGTAHLINAFQDQIAEYEWRLNVQVPVPPNPET